MPDAPTNAPAPWLRAAAPATPDLRLGRRLVCLLLAGFAIVLWFGVPHGIGTSWRECDTQTIARNFLLDGFDPLRPRVDWRGDTDGAVECEFPFYQLLIAAVMAVVGEAEWPGRLLSLLSTLLSAWVLHRLLELRVGASGAFAGLCAFLCTGSASMLAARVIPDGLSLAATCLGLLAFVRHLATGGSRPLLLAVLALSLAGLQKPLALQAGLVMFGWSVVLAPQRLRDGRLWAGFVFIPLVVAAWLLHGRALHAETGLSFGVVSGGDSKFPDLAHAFDPAVYGGILQTTARFGFSIFAMAALVVLGVRRRLDRTDAVLLLATAIGLFVSMRYSCTEALGPQYHSFAALAGAWIVARAWPERAPRWAWLLFLALVAVHAGLRARNERGVRIVVNQHAMMAIARETMRHARPGELLLVRSDKAERDEEWRRPQNFEDPRFFYRTGRRGFVVAQDQWDVATIQDRQRRGARIAFDPTPERTADEVHRWLADNGELLVAGAGGRVYRLLARP